MGFLEELEFKRTYTILAFLPLRYSSLFSPIIYFYILFTLNPKYKIKQWEYCLFIPFFIDMSFQCYKTICYLNGVMDDYIFGQPGRLFIVNSLIEALNGISALVVCSIMLLELRKYEKNLYNQYSEITSKSVKWISNTICGGMLIIVYWIIFNFLGFNLVLGPTSHDRVIWFGLSVFVYWGGYGVIIRPELFTHTQKIINPVASESPAISKLSENTDIYHQKLLKLMSTNELFRDPDFKLDQLAKEMNLSKGYLSQIINVKERKNFFDFVNHYRVEDVKQKLKDESFDHYSILAIALEAGFKSKSTFNAVFKKITGVTPSKFKQTK